MNKKSLFNYVRGSLWQLAIQSSDTRFDKLERLNNWQNLGPEETSNLQRKQLQDLLDHCYENVPYYRSLFQEKDFVTDDGNIKIDEFEQLPLLEKETIRSEFENLKSDDLSSRSWYQNTSGGSTGEPVTFVQDKNYNDWNRAVTALFRRWTGYQPGEPWVMLWGSERDLFDERKAIRSQIGDWLRNRTLLNSFQMDPEQMEEYLNKINNIKPTFILAYVESIADLAQFANRNNKSVHSPQSIMTTAGTLYPDVRETIEKTFETDVYNRYGSREVGDIACECSEHEGLHISAPTHYVEVLNRNGNPVDPGEPGEVVVTSLTNYAMPLVRYRIGDIAVKTSTSCSCGRGWPQLSEIKGRVSDVFITKDGTRIHGEFFTHLFYHEDWVEKFQIVQEDVDQIHIKIVTRGDCDLPANKIDEICESIQTVMGECSVRFDRTESINRTDSGKYRYTISKVQNDEY